MCNQYTTKASAAEVASWFSAKVTSEMNAGPGMVFPKEPGMVVRLDGGQRVVRKAVAGGGDNGEIRGTSYGHAEPLPGTEWRRRRGIGKGRHRSRRAASRYRAVLTGRSGAR